MCPSRRSSCRIIFEIVMFGESSVCGVNYTYPRESTNFTQFPIERRVHLYAAVRSKQLWRNTEKYGYGSGWGSVGILFHDKFTTRQNAENCCSSWVPCNKFVTIFEQQYPYNDYTRCTAYCNERKLYIQFEYLQTNFRAIQILYEKLI